MLSTTVSIDIAALPETLWSLCHQLADVLREAALEEAEEYTQKRLLELADEFEAGGNSIRWPEHES